MPRRRRLISCPETKIAAERSGARGGKTGEKEKKKGRAKEGKFGERNQDVSPCSVVSYRRERYTYIGPERGNKVRVCVCAEMSLCWPELHPCASVPPPPCFSRSYVRGFENGRRSYELALEDNYDGDPRTTIYYAVT